MRTPLVVLTALALAIAGCSSTDDPGPQADGAASGSTTPAAAPSASAEVDGPSWLFVIESGEGTAAPAGDGTVELRFAELGAEVTAFTDRPDRTVSTESPEDFVARWAERGFDDDPPNAAIALADQRVVVVTLTDPSIDDATGALVVTGAELDGGTDVVAGRSGAPPADLPSDLGATSVFVDAAPSASTGIVIASFTYEGTGEPNVLIDNDIAPLERPWMSSVETESSDASALGASVTPDEGTVVAFTNDGGSGLVSVVVPLVPDSAGGVTGAAAEIPEGGTLTGTLIDPPGAAVTIADGQSFTLAPEG